MDALDQVLYLGRWVPKKYFRVFVHNGIESKLANSYDEFSQLIASGLWLDKPFAPSCDIVPIQSTRKRQKKEASNG